ncbi:hypothetical protein JCM8208_007174 [Rhodotorula glutinis]
MLAGSSSAVRPPQAVYSRWSSYDTPLVPPAPPSAAVPRSPATSAFSLDELDDLIDSYSKSDHYTFTPPTSTSSCDTSSASVETASSTSAAAGGSSRLATGLVVPSPSEECELVRAVSASSSGSSSRRTSPHPSPKLPATPLSPAYPFPRMRVSPRAALAKSQARSRSSCPGVDDEQAQGEWSDETVRPRATALRPPLLSAFSTWSSSRTDESGGEPASVGSSRNVSMDAPPRSGSWSAWEDWAVEGAGPPRTAVGAPWSASTALFPSPDPSSSSLDDVPIFDDLLLGWEHVVETVDPTDARADEAELEAHEAGDGFPWGID